MITATANDTNYISKATLVDQNNHELKASRLRLNKSMELLEQMLCRQEKVVEDFAKTHRHRPVKRN